MIELHNGDCLEVLKGFDDNCIDSIVTDPPYGLEFMGKKWDYDVPSVEIWQECLRVLKPGGTALIFAGSRTQHRMAVNVEDAGFILKDTIEYFLKPDVQAFYRTLNQQQKKDFLSLTGGNTMFWIYGSGFPKSLDISKAIDKEAGLERKAVGVDKNRLRPNRKYKSGAISNIGGKDTNAICDRTDNGATITEPATEDAKKWSGYGTAIKPSYEPIIIAMKPNDGTYANNALKHGVAGLNIDDCRVELQPEGEDKRLNGKGSWKARHSNLFKRPESTFISSSKGRFPANIIHDGSEDVVSLFPKTKTGSLNPSMNIKESTGWSGGSKADRIKNIFTGDSGSAARFFYCAKASKAERNLGMNSNNETLVKHGENYRKRENADWQKVNGNFHPTVKPLELMEYLCKLVKTPTGGKTLDPFMGSGTTGIAVKKQGTDFIGIERDPDYFKIAEKRIDKATHQMSF